MSFSLLKYTMYSMTPFLKGKVEEEEDVKKEDLRAFSILDQSRKPCVLGQMTSSAGIFVYNGSSDKLLCHLMGLDQCQLEEFKLCLQSAQQLPENVRKMAWADLKAISPTNLLCLMKEHLSVRQVWAMTLHVFEHMKLTSLWEQMRAEMTETAQVWGPQDPNQEDPEMPEEETDHRRRYRERVRTKILVLWDNTPWPEDHIYLRNVMEQEHEELRSLLHPNRTGAQPLTVVLEGMAGVGKTTLAMKAVLHWAQGVLFQHRFSYVFYISCHKVGATANTTLAGLLSWDWPDSQVPIDEFRGHPERLLFVLDGLEEVAVSSDLYDSPPCTDWYQQLPVARILLHLLKKELVPTATLLIITRGSINKDLKHLLVNPCFVISSGFTEGDREEYLIRFFGDQDKAKKILHWMRKRETLFHSCSAPLVCWAVCSSLKWQMVNPSFQLSTQTATSLYAYFFCSLFAMAEVSLSDQSSPEQWRAFCCLAAEGMWLSNFTFAKEVMERRHLEASFTDSLLRLNILRKVSDCEDCIAFSHQSFQVFFGAMFYVLWGTRGSLGGPPKHQEMRVFLNDAFTNANIYWHQMALFFFGLLNTDLARELQDALHCAMSPRIMEELLDWAEDLEKYNAVSVHFEFLQFFQCLHETQDENFTRRVLNHVLEADLDIRGHQHLRVSSFCLQHCQKLRKLRISVSGPILETKSTSALETLETSVVNFRKRQWEDICSVFCNGNMRELDLSNSKLNTSSMKELCYKLRNPRCKLQKLTCKSMSPVKILRELVIVLHGNHKLTHLDLSSNNLGITVSKVIFRSLRHSACNLKYLWLEKCSLSVASCQDLALLLTSTRGMTRLCLGLNQLRDDGVRLLCASLTHPECVLERLELWSCQLRAPSCRYLSDALLQNKSLTHLNLRKNNLGDEGVKFLCEALSRPDCNLQNLILSDCSFTVEGCRQLAHALKQNHRVKILDVGKNDAQDGGVRELCRILKRPDCVLETLGLEKCNLTSDCCWPLASVLRSSKSLVNLNLLGNDLGPEGVNTLWTSLKKSTCKLRKLG
ncbi:NACHT, LRR and PYD domains-containing protein 13 [Hippopotamus amphibius kiboko]|uniref:NACHT, LRR and PYD domains-containing protein 13 n=1 Tax=Hippopotamus amphibius kiboko TaxID=575201 RepID=UPI002595CB47|nr:NACHT, LRR and PYD domains-containing protein 13 [Hippopotamus amphibius kiboko]